MREILFVAVLIGCGERVVYVQAPTAPIAPAPSQPRSASATAQGSIEHDSWWCTTTWVTDQAMQTTIDACYRGRAACDGYRTTTNADDPSLRYGPCIDYPAVACFRFSKGGNDVPWCWTNAMRCRAAESRVATMPSMGITSPCTVIE